MSREEEDKFIRGVMSELARGIGYERVEEDIESILPDKDNYEILKEDIESILPDEGYEVVEEDTMESGLPDKEETMASVAARAEEFDTNLGGPTMVDLASDLDEKPVGDSDKDTMDALAQEIAILKAKMKTAKVQREEIAGMKKELSMARGGPVLVDQRKGISR